MHCDHKRVWEMKSFDVHAFYLKMRAALDEGYQPFTAVGSVMYFKRLTPCQTCLEEQEREKKHVDDYKNNSIIGDRCFAKVGDIFMLRGERCVVRRVYHGGFEYRYDDQSNRPVYTHVGPYLPKDT